MTGTSHLPLATTTAIRAIITEVPTAITAPQCRSASVLAEATMVAIMEGIAEAGERADLTDIFFNFVEY